LRSRSRCAAGGRWTSISLVGRRLMEGLDCVILRLITVGFFCKRLFVRYDPEQSGMIDRKNRIYI
jgi:hypothetical protein